MSKRADSIHDRIDFAAYYPEGEDENGERKVRCFYPDHNDTSPSMGINLETGQYNCFSCGKRGNAITYARDILGWSYEHLARKFGLKKWIDPESVGRFAEALLRNEAKLNWLLNERGLSLEVVKRFQLGLDGNRYVIPIVEDGEVVNLRRYLPEAKRGADKMRNETGFGAARLWSQEVLEDAETIVVCEGEMDALCLLSNDIPAVTGTGGAETWKKEWSPLFAGKHVVVCYDIDEVGQRCAAAVVKGVKPYAASVRNVLLPLDREGFPKGDVTDYFVHHNYEKNDFLYLVEDATPEDGPKAEAPKEERVYEVSLSSASQAQYFMKRIRSDVIVSAKDTAPFFVPRLFTLKCQMGMKVCGLCPVSQFQGEMECELEADDPLLLELINRSDLQKIGALRKHVGIPKGCSAHTFDHTESFNIEEVRLVPQFTDAIDPSKRDEYVVRRSFYVGHGIETNAPFRIEALTMPEPATQYATHLIYEATPAVDNLSEFNLSAAQVKRMHKAFSPTKPTTKALYQALTRRYDDLEANVTHIWGRRPTHLFVDLLVHSVLYFPFNKDIQKGYLEGLLIGDSGQGKSAVTIALQRHYHIGERVDAGAATVAGLKGGLQESQKRWWVTWGIIPQNDRRWVILEEIKNAHPDILAKLRDMRSSGIAEVAGIERQRTNARTRLLWVSNPRGSRQVGSYDYGVSAIKELMGHLEDVRRFDFAHVVSSGDVAGDLINRPAGDWPKVKAVRTADLCRDLVLWAWSRKAADVIFEPGATDEVLCAAKAMAKDYHPAIPLVEPADQRLKVARTSVALAALLFSTEDGRELRVTKAHVEVAEAVLRDFYNAPAMAYDRFSAQQFLDESVSDLPEILQAFQSIPHPWDLVQGLLLTNYLSKTDVAEFSGVPERRDVDRLVGLLVRKRALRKYNTQYRKTPAFITWLRSLKREQLKGTPVSQSPADQFLY